MLAMGYTKHFCHMQYNRGCYLINKYTCTVCIVYKLTFSGSVSPPATLLQADADSFYATCNGRQFNSIEEAVCQLVYVERAEVFKSEEVGSWLSPAPTLFCHQFQLLPRLNLSVQW